MSDGAVTGWIDGSPLADRPGWYDLWHRGSGYLGRWWWDGERWRGAPWAAPSRRAGTPRGFQFRGLTAPAKA